MGDLARLVVTAKDCDAVGVADLESDEKGDGFDGVVATIDVVACGDMNVSICLCV